jgi:hypothetical protein
MTTSACAKLVNQCSDAPAFLAQLQVDHGGAVPSVAVR